MGFAKPLAGKRVDASRSEETSDLKDILLNEWTATNAKIVNSDRECEDGKVQMQREDGRIFTSID